MSRPRARKPERNAGAFMSPDGGAMIPVPMSTLSDEYRDEPTEPEDEHEPEPDPPGLFHRVVERLARRSDPGTDG